MKAKKSLGQHFLTNKYILADIVAAAEITAEDTVLEVGPGTGFLTDALVATGARIIAVEKDDLLASDLGMKYGGRVEIINQDILAFNPSRYTLHDTRYTIIGNIPYYLTSHLIRIILTTWPKPKSIVFMVQKEVARRMTAKPPEMNMLAVLVQLYTTPTIIKIVKRGNFNPVPKVDSAIIKLVPALHDTRDTLHLLDIAAQGFKNPRKMLGNNLSRTVLVKAGIDPKRRAETLTIQEWKKIADSMV